MRPASPSPDGDRPADRWMLLAAAIPVLAFLLHETYSLDVWWQVAIGRDVLAKGELSRIDVYQVAAERGLYHDAHWLFQLVVASVERWTGMAGVQLATLGVWIPTLLLTYRATRRWLDPTWASVLVFLAAMASVERFLPRPEIVTFFGIAAFWVLLQEGHDRSWPGRAAFALLQVVWTACHGLFVIGPFLVGCVWLEAAVDRVRGGMSPDLRSRSVLLAIVLAATLVSPFPVENWRYVGLMLTQVGGSWAPGVFDTLGELSPTFGSAARSGTAFWFFLALLVASLTLIPLAFLRGLRSVGRGLAVGGLMVAALTGRRNVVLFALVAAPFLAESLAVLLPTARLRLRPAGKALAAALMVTWASYPLSGRYYLHMEIPARFGWGVTPSFFPHALPDFLERIDFRGNVLNSNTLGGFYVYHGFPERLPLTDGRWVTVEPELLDWTMAAVADPVAWRQVVERFDVEGLLLAHTSPEAAAILPGAASDPGWRLVYLDHAASFWLRAGGTHLPPVVDPDDPTGLPEIRRPEDGLFLATFLRHVGAHRSREPVLEWTIERGPWDAQLLGELGLLQIEQGRYDRAEATFRRQLVLDADNPVALNELAFLAYQRGELAEAMALMERALEADPDNEAYRNNYERLRTAVGER